MVYMRFPRLFLLRLLRLPLLALCFIALCASLHVATASSQVEQADHLLIRTRAGDLHKITVELAISESEQRRGLMFRTRLERSHGMLFLHKPPRIVKMWMKDTYIPLDMIFIDMHGEIVKIAERTRPLSLRVISSEVEVSAVLEVASGSVRDLGVAVGDMIEYEFLQKDLRKGE